MSKDIDKRNFQHITRPVIYFIKKGTLGKMETSFERYQFSSDLKNRKLVEQVNSDIYLKRDKQKAYLSLLSTRKMSNRNI